MVYEDAARPGVDVRYEVSGQVLKEELVLAAPPAGDARFVFTLDLDGLAAVERPDGSIGLYPGDTDVEPLLVMPPPFMVDSAEVPASPYGSAWSRQVSQSLERVGDQLRVMISADREWLDDPARVYPVTIDPTIKIRRRRRRPRRRTP